MEIFCSRCVGDEPQNTSHTGPLLHNKSVYNTHPQNNADENRSMGDI